MKGLLDNTRWLVDEIKVLPGGRTFDLRVRAPYGEYLRAVGGTSLWGANDFLNNLLDAHNAQQRERPRTGDIRVQDIEVKRVGTTGFDARARKHFENPNGKYVGMSISNDILERLTGGFDDKQGVNYALQDAISHYIAWKETGKLLPSNNDFTYKMNVSTNTIDDLGDNQMPQMSMYNTVIVDPRVDPLGDKAIVFDGRVVATSKASAKIKALMLAKIEPDDIENYTVTSGERIIWTPEND